LQVTGSLGEFVTDDPEIVELSAEQAQRKEAEFLDKVPLRDEAMVSIGGAMYLAASPDEFDGLSESEWNVFTQNGPEAFRVLELLGRLGVPENMRLPEGFADHFRDEVLPDLYIIRQSPELREQFRKEMRNVLGNRQAVKNLYRGGGTTFSQIASDVAGTARTGKFYREKRPVGSERGLVPAGNSGNPNHPKGFGKVKSGHKRSGDRTPIGRNR
jgi:hypothetical protein